MRKVTIGGEFYDAGVDLPDESLIMAYVDDELDQEGRRYVEDLLARSAEAREIADLMRSSSALMKSAFHDDPKADSRQEAGCRYSRTRAGKSQRRSHSPDDQADPPLPPDFGCRHRARPIAAQGLTTGQQRKA